MIRAGFRAWFARYVAGCVVNRLKVFKFRFYPTADQRGPLAVEFGYQHGSGEKCRSDCARRFARSKAGTCDEARIEPENFTEVACLERVA